MNISPPPVEEFEVRVVVWRTKDIQNMDDEGCSDVFIRAYFDPTNHINTDVHWRCSDGNASFNYRVLLPVNSSAHEHVLTVEAWDQDVFSSNDFIGSFSLDLK